MATEASVHGHDDQNEIYGQAEHSLSKQATES